MVERKENFPEIGPTDADSTPSKVLSSICFTSSIPGKQVENLLMSIKKSQASSAGTFKSIFPSKIIVVSAERNSGAILCEKNSPGKSRGWRENVIDQTICNAAAGNLVVF